MGSNGNGWETILTKGNIDMSKINCNTAKAASAIFTSDIEGLKLLHTDNDSFKFKVLSSELRECTLSIDGLHDAASIEVSVDKKHHCFGHPNSKFALYILADESNDTFVNATRLAIAALEKQVHELESDIDIINESIFTETNTYVFDEKNSIKDTVAKLLAHNLEHKLPDDWVIDTYKKPKDPDDKDSVDRYVNVDLGDVDMNKVTAIKHFFEDWNVRYSDLEPVNKMMLKSVRDAINWVLEEAGSDQRVDSNTVLATLLLASLDSKHNVFDERDKITDNMVVMVPDSIFTLFILYRDKNKTKNKK